MLRFTCLRKWFSHRFGIVLLVITASVVISFLTRLSLLLLTPGGTGQYNLPGIFGIGLLYDLTVGFYIIIPFVLQIWLTNEKMYSSGWWKPVAGIYLLIILLLVFTQIIPDAFNEDLRKVVIGYFIFRFLIFLLLAWRGAAFRQQWRTYILSIEFLLVVFLLLMNAVSEWFFWEEFSTRYNFIAVDYLIYTTEVIGNIRQSYPVGLIMAGVLSTAIIVLLLVRKSIARSQQHALNFRSRTVLAMAFLLLPVAGYFLVPGSWKKFSANAYANELAGNGMFEFASAFRNNELDFFRFYKVLPDKEAFRIIRQQLATPHSHFVGTDPFTIEREISYPDPENKMNVVLVSVESLSADFMKAFGGQKNITPYLDSLSTHSLFFTNLYASGTRTVRGLEALSLSIPPTPGQSIVKRPDNEQLFSLGAVLRDKGYITQYIYGGYSYFDNMRDFFSNNGYEVIDRSALPPDSIHYANIWGVADEDLFTLALNRLDDNYRQQKPFFTHVMTVSNHRPFTYPEDRIDISPALQVRDGAVKYTDYAINKFLKEAHEKPWFNNTIFIIVADHCAGSAGSVELPVTGYHIPLLIYSPAYLQPQKIDRLMAQIDIAPTILGLLKIDYRSKFFGQDIFDLPPGNERAFISTYQGLGYLRNGKLVIQSPVMQIADFIPDFVTGNAERTIADDSLEKQAIAYYQTASWLLKNNKYSFK